MACFVSAILFATTPKASAVVPWHHGFSVPYGIPAGEENWGRALTAQAGSDTMRIALSWDAYQTGPNEYNQKALDDIVGQVQAARAWSPYAFDPKAMIIFELPNYAVPWMQAAGYQLQEGVSNTGSTKRFYPLSFTGQQAYGKAMAKALKYLYQVGIAQYIETPNEPNLLNGPAQAVPAEYIGRLGGFGLAYAAAEGVPVTSPGGPEVLIGSVSTNPGTAQASEGKTPAEYFRLVQTSANYHIALFYQGTPNGQSTAEWLMGFWRASFHSYPKLGQGENTPCELQWTSKGWRLQDELGDVTGYKAYTEVQNRLIPVINVLNEVPAKKNWWVTETGMSSYKIPEDTQEGQTQCLNRRANGGNNYGKEQQKKFYENFAYYQEWQKSHSGYPWSGWEGVTFFSPLDTTYAYNDPYKGFGVFNPGCGNYCWKPSAVYFANTL